jgi:cold shock CspA family protein
MGKSHESFSKKDVRTKKEKKRKEKEKKRLARKENEKPGSLDDMIAYVDEYGMITSTTPVAGKKVETNLEDIQISIPKKENILDTDPIRKGIVSFFNATKGFGFIRDLKNGKEYFVHINNVSGEIHDGSAVSFEVGSGPKGPMAVNVKVSIDGEEG